MNVVIDRDATVGRPDGVHSVGDGYRPAGVSTTDARHRHGRVIDPAPLAAKAAAITIGREVRTPGWFAPTDHPTGSPAQVARPQLAPQHESSIELAALPALLPRA